MTELLQWLEAMHAADRSALDRVRDALPQIERAAARAADVLDAGGRWFYCGAGTSGRIGALDASELPPTFGVDPRLATALLAGGREAMFEAREGAEDDEAAGGRDLAANGCGARDLVIGLAASGRTPYVVGALRAARDAGAATICIVCADGSPIAALAEIPIVVATGPEVLSGSTRLKAATAQKIVLNMISTGAMARRGLVVRGEMVAMRPTNAKLRRRAVRIASDLLHVGADAAEELLHRSGWDLPVALVGGRFGVGPEEARERLRAAGGNVARALGETRVLP